MTRRDFAHFVGWVALVVIGMLALAKLSAVQQSHTVALAAATKALEKTARLESKIEALEAEIERLSDENQLRAVEWQTLSRDVDALELHHKE